MFQQQDHHRNTSTPIMYFTQIHRSATLGNRSLSSRPQKHAPAMNEPLRIPKAIREMEVGNLFPRQKHGGRRDKAIRKGVCPLVSAKHTLHNLSSVIYL